MVYYNDEKYDLQIKYIKVRSFSKILFFYPNIRLKKLITSSLRRVIDSFVFNIFKQPNRPFDLYSVVSGDYLKEISELFSGKAKNRSKFSVYY